MPMLEVDNIHSYYGNIHALKGVSLTVEKGEIVTLIGGNGAGNRPRFERSQERSNPARAPSDSRVKICTLISHMRSYIRACPWFPRVGASFLA